MRILQQCLRPVGAAFLLCLATLLVVQVSPAQSDLENVLKQYTSQTVKGYIQPMADLFGANLNAGLYHSAAIPENGLKFEIDLVGMGSTVGDDQKTYTLQLPASFAQGSMKAPTIFGPKATLVTDPTTGLQFKPTDGLIDASLFPLAVPQLTIGAIAGTEANIRFITTPSISNEKFPKTTLWGIGARHSISQYLPEPPLDIAAGIFYSKFTVGDIIDCSGLSIGAQASKSFSVLNLYGGLAWEQSTMNLSYKPTASSTSVDVDLDGANNFRFTVGAGLHLAVLNIFADANFGSITNFSGGIGFGF